MRKITSLFATVLLVVLFAAGAIAQPTLPTFDSASYLKTAGHIGIYRFHIHDTDTVTIHYWIETITDTTGTGTPSFTDSVTLTVTGNMTISDSSLYGVDTNSSYVRTHWDTVGGIPHVTPWQFMLRPGSIAFTVLRTATHLYPTVTVDPGNGVMPITGRLGYDAGFTGSTPIHSYTVIGTPLVIHDTVPYTQTPETAYWIRYSGNNGYLPVTITQLDSTLALVPGPTAADSAITIGSSTISRRIKANVYGVSGGYAKEFAYDSTTMALVDTQTSLLTATTGTQSPIYAHTSLLPSHAYILKLYVHDTGGSVWVIDTVRTAALPVATITVDSISYTKIIGDSGLVALRITDTASVPMRFRVETNTNSTFTGVPSLTGWDTVMVSGVIVLNVHGNDTAVDWARAIWNKIGDTTNHTTSGVIMYRHSSLVIAHTSSTTHLYASITVTPSNGPTVVTGILSYDSTFSSTTPIHTYTITAMTTTVILDTVPYVLGSYTPYWRKYTTADTLGTHVYIIKDTTLPLISLPYIADDGLPTITSTSGARNIKLDVYGSTGAYFKFFVDSLGIRVDSQYQVVPAVVGVQYFSPTTIHRASSHMYVWNIELTNSVGSTWIATDSFLTEPPISTLGFTNDTVKLTNFHSNIHLVTGYTNTPGDMCDLNQMVFRVGSTVPISITTTGLTLPIGTVTSDIAISMPGTYFVYNYGHNYSGDIAFSDTTILVVNTPHIHYFTATPATGVHPGDSVVLSYYITDGDTTSIIDSVAGTITPVTDSGSITVVASITTTYQLITTGLTTVTKDLILPVTARPDTTDTATMVNLLVKEKARIFPNPCKGEIHIEGDTKITNIEMYNMVGRCILQLTPMSEDIEINSTNYPDGKYLLLIRYEDNSTEKQNICISR